YLSKIIRISNDGKDIDTIALLDIRFNQSPNSNQVALSSDNKNTPDVVRAELILKNGKYERSVVIDGGNICNVGEIDEPEKCNGSLIGGPRPGRVFIVNRQ